MISKKEALDNVESINDRSDCIFEDELNIIEKYINQSPTSEEVCKALSEYTLKMLGKKVSYLCEGQQGEKHMFILEKNDNPLCALIDGKVLVNYILPPHLITMIGQFYETLNK